MLSIETKKEIFDMYDELSFVKRDILGEVLLIYYIYQGENAVYTYNDKKLLVEYFKEDISANIENALIIGGDPIFDEKYVNKVITAFLNSGVNLPECEWVVYINPEKRVAQLVGDADTYLYIERIVPAIITRIMPWLFENLDKEIRNLVADSLNNIEYSKFDLVFNELLQKKGIINELYKKQLSSMGKHMLKMQIDHLKINIDSMDRHIRELMDSIGLYSEQKRNYQMQLHAYQSSTDMAQSPIDEILEFIEMTPEDVTISDVDTEDSSVTLLFHTQLDQFSEDAYVANIENCSYLYEYFTTDEKYSFEQINKMFKTILKGEGYKIWCDSLININLKTPRVVAMPIENVRLKNAMRHPHLNNEISCFGTADGVIVQYLSDFRFAEALMQITYASKQITLYDGAAGARFISGIKRFQCIECPDGKFRTAIEILDEIIKEEE